LVPQVLWSSDPARLHVPELFLLTLTVEWVSESRWEKKSLARKNVRGACSQGPRQVAGRPLAGEKKNEVEPTPLCAATSPQGRKMATRSGR
jgi:hypothetical protein